VKGMSLIYSTELVLCGKIAVSPSKGYAREIDLGYLAIRGVASAEQ
jgi:hypothetical protein